jgi:hypothetical protein
MTASGNQGAQTMGVLFRVLVLFDTAALLFAAAIHVQGVNISLGAGSFVESQIVPAALVEGLAGIVFASAAYAVLMGRTWAWRITLIAHIFAILGFILGIVSTRNGTTTFNHDYHLAMLAVFAIGLVLLFMRGAQVALGRILG